ncbi:MAG TPA: glycogen debranching N-terminal domain-containing protein [Dehalococcoidia bacterium]|nr:glycogen debranching N-terminal domain-containing protein [Dehalococcoidia bacterium]
MTKHQMTLRARSGERSVYSGRSVLVTNLYGEVQGHDTEGFYVRNTRMLSKASLTLDGKQLEPFAETAVDAHAALGYLRPQREAGGETSAYIEVARFVGDGMRMRIRVEESWRDGRTCELGIHLAADFADIEEAHTGRRQQQAPVRTEWDAERQEVRFLYEHPKVPRATTVRIERAPGRARFEDGVLLIDLDLPRHAPVEVELAVEATVDGETFRAPPASFDDRATALGRVRARLRDDAPRIMTSNATVAQAWRTAMADLSSLPLGLEAGAATPIAGLPRYLQFFGRDSLTIGRQALMVMPSMLGDVLRANASAQGTKFDDWRDEEPGKMLHQTRDGPLSELGINPFRHYFGDYAAAPEFLTALGQYLLWTDDRATVRAMLPAARRVLEWLERYGDLDGDGFLEYVTRSDKGLKNQGWKDASNAVVDESGRIIANPIATCELQANWYAGLRQAAMAFSAAGERRYALRLMRQARELRSRFDRAFWMEDAGYYAFALGPDKRQVRSIASNAGHLLGTGIVPAEKAVRVAQRLMRPDLFSGWGVRTLSRAHISFNPFSYHLGSVWPFENAVIAHGLGSCGAIDEMHRLAGAMFDATSIFEDGRLPECMGGMQRDEDHPHPGLYPESNERQGWSASAIPLIVQSILGMRSVAPLQLLAVDPQLPAWLPDLRIEGVRVGDGRVDLEAWRTRGGATRYRVQADGVRVVREVRGFDAHPGMLVRAA